MWCCIYSCNFSEQFLIHVLNFRTILLRYVLKLCSKNYVLKIMFYFSFSQFRVCISLVIIIFQKKSIFKKRTRFSKGKIRFFESSSKTQQSSWLWITRLPRVPRKRTDRSFRRFDLLFIFIVVAFLFSKSSMFTIHLIQPIHPPEDTFFCLLRWRILNPSWLLFFLIHRDNGIKGTRFSSPSKVEASASKKQQNLNKESRIACNETKLLFLIFICSGSPQSPWVQAVSSMPLVLRTVWMN